MLAGALCCACGDRAAEDATLRLVQARPTPGGQVFLNEPLVLTFSRPLDLTSVTPESVVLRTERGAARGSWEVDGRVLRFVPAPILEPDLSAGGYEPGQAHHLTLAGFPRLGGLRAVDGTPFEATRSLSWRAVDPAAGPAFYDLGRNPTACEPVTLIGTDGRPAVGSAGVRIAPGAPIRLVCDEPFDPSTVDAASFEVLDLTGDEGDVQARIPVRATLVRNDAPTGAPGSRTAVLELDPVRRLESGPHRLRMLEGNPLADMGGNLAFPRLGRFQHQRPFQVAPVATGSSDRETLEFGDEDVRRTTAVPVVGADGTASVGRGRVTVSFPRSAGLGGEEERLEGRSTSSEHAGVRLEVPAGARFELSRDPGVVVLRAQGTLRVSGDLLRVVETSRETTPPSAQVGTLEHAIEAFVAGEAEAPDERRARSDAQRAERGRAPLPDAQLPAPLGPADTFQRRVEALEPDVLGFLEAARRTGTDWTVLIAGGDLVVDGTLDLATHVLLVAGGRIRLDGQSARLPEHVFTVGAGGGILARSTARIERLGVVLRPPERNPLREPLTWSVVTTPLPRVALERHRWRSWHASGHAGHGSWRVRWLPPDGPADPALAVDHPAQLPEGPVRALIELTVDAGRGERWDPPTVDFLELVFEVR